MQNDDNEDLVGNPGENQQLPHPPPETPLVFPSPVPATDSRRAAASWMVAMNATSPNANAGILNEHEVKQRMDEENQLAHLKELERRRRAGE
jgi:hypothetical protein